MSSLTGSHSIGDQICNGNQEKRPLLREQIPQVLGSSASSRRENNNENTTAIIQIPVPAPERAEPRYKPEKCKTLVAFLFAGMGLLSNLFVLAYIHDRVPDRDKVPPLPDIFYDIFPAIDPALEASEVIIIASLWTCVFLMTMHRYRWIVFRRVFVITGVLYTMRAITMLVTQVPISSTTYYCSPRATSKSVLTILQRVLQLCTGFGLSINGRHTFCGDYIFSGHTLMLTLGYLIVKEYSPQRCRWLHIFYFCASFFGVFCILLARGHYTIDVILGYYFTSRVFWIYHSLCAAQISNKANMSLSNSPLHYLSRVWWYPIFRYFEVNVTGPVPRQYEWPLPWPRRCLTRTRIS